MGTSAVEDKRPLVSVSVIFFFQAEDGIRDIGVTGVQTCALPISTVVEAGAAMTGRPLTVTAICLWAAVLPKLSSAFSVIVSAARLRSEERRVGKEGRSRWSPYH